MSEKKLGSTSGFNIPKMNFFNTKSLNSCSSLSDLAAHNLKLTNNNKQNAKNVEFKIPKINCSIDVRKSENPTFSSLADLTAHHLKIKNEKITKLEENVLKKDLTNHSKSLDDSNESRVITKKLAVLNIKCENFNDVDLKTNLDGIRIDNCAIVKQEKFDKDSDERIKVSNDTLICLLDENKKLLTSKKQCKVFLPLKKVPSSFGKILCKRYKKVTTPYEKNLLPRADQLKKNLEKNVTRFNFTSQSPDALILSRLKKN